MTRHAKNRARSIEASLAEVEGLIDDPLQVETDEDGRPLYSGVLRGIHVRVVVALDEPGLIVTIHEKRK
jgi:hypothetical protein